MHHSYGDALQSSTQMPPPQAIFASIPRNHSYDENGTIQEFQNLFEFLSARPTQFDKIHLVRPQHKKTLPKSFCKKCKGLIIKKKFAIPFHRHGCDLKQTLYEYVSKFTLCFTKFSMNLKKITMKKWLFFNKQGPTIINK